MIGDFYTWRRGKETWWQFFHRILPKGAKEHLLENCCTYRWEFDLKKCKEEDAITFIKKLNKDWFLAAEGHPERFRHFGEDIFMKDYKEEKYIFFEIERKTPPDWASDWYGKNQYY